MKESKGVSDETYFPEKGKGVVVMVARTQLQAIKEAKKILEEVLKVGISSVDIEYREDLCYDVENLIEYYSPCVIRSFRHLFSILYHANNPRMYPLILAHMNYLIVMTENAKTYLEGRIKERGGPDISSTIDAHLGYMWRNLDFLEYNQYEKNAEIIQLSFYSKVDNERMIYVDKAYWMNLVSGQVYFTRKIRPKDASKYIRKNNSEFDVLQPEYLFIYPGKINNRIRWKGAEKRNANANDIITLHNYAESNYADFIDRMKRSFREALAEQSPVALIKLHKAFIQGEYLILEDESGNLLTVADILSDDEPTAELLRAVLPSKPNQFALLVQVNYDVKANLFSVKPLSVITTKQIVRLLY